MSETELEYEERAPTVDCGVVVHRRKVWRSAQEKAEWKAYCVRIKEYRKSLHFHLMVTRFTEDTLRENRAFLEKNRGGVKCIYGTPIKVTKDIPFEGVLFVLEMNNTANRIEGVGMVKNHLATASYAVYANPDYNRFVYAGKERIAREDMTEDEQDVLAFFDHTCFRGKRHLKRGIGVTSYPLDILLRCKGKLDLVLFVRNMFRKRLGLPAITPEPENI